MSWRAEYADDSGRWTTNGLRFATKQEAEDYVSELAIRWTAVRETRSGRVRRSGELHLSRSPAAPRRGNNGEGNANARSR